MSADSSVQNCRLISSSDISDAREEVESHLNPSAQPSSMIADGSVGGFFPLRAALDTSPSVPPSGLMIHSTGFTL